MSDDSEAFDPPVWVRWLLLGSTVAAVGGRMLFGRTPIVDAVSVVAALTVVYVLYLWGKHRDPPGGDGGGKDRKKGELDGKGGGMGYA